MVGIVMKYCQNDATLVGLTIADHLTNLAIPFRLLRYGIRARSIDKHYDNRLFKLPRQDWLENIKCLIWTTHIDEHIVFALAQEGIINVIYAGWDQLRDVDLASFFIYDSVLLPFKAERRLIRENTKAATLVHLPYSPALPIIKKQDLIESKKVKLFISLYGNQLKNTEIAALQLLGGLARKYKHVSVTVAYCTKLSKQANKVCNKFRKDLGPRFKLKRICDWKEHIKELAEHDLTIIAAKKDNFGISGLTSLHYGTPIVCWKVEGYTDYINRNGILIDCETILDEDEIQVAIPNYDKLRAMLQTIVNEPKLLD